MAARKPSEPPVLARRIEQVCDGTLRGLLNKEIAAEMGVSEGTVKTYKFQAAKRLGCRGHELTSRWFQEKRRRELREVLHEIAAWCRAHQDQWPEAARKEIWGLINRRWKSV